MNNPVKSALYQGKDVLDYALTDYTLREQAKVIIGKNKIPDYIYPSEKIDNSRYYDDPETHRSENAFIKRARELRKKLVIDKNSYDDLNSLIKLYFLAKSKCKKYMGKTYQYVTIKLKKQTDIFCAEDMEVLLDSQDTIWSKTTKLERKEENSLFNTLAIYFLYECQYYYGNGIFDDIEEISLKQIERVAEVILGMISRNIEDTLQENMMTDEYFYNAAKDLILFYGLGKENRIVDSGWEKMI